jgi:hypothetical protein
MFPEKESCEVPLAYILGNSEGATFLFAFIVDDTFNFCSCQRGFHKISYEIRGTLKVELRIDECIIKEAAELVSNPYIYCDVKISGICCLVATSLFKIDMYA